MKRILVALALVALVAGGFTAWEHHDVRAVACTHLPNQPC